MLFGLLLLLSTAHAAVNVTGLDSASFCILSSTGQPSDTKNCTLGEIVLIGKYLNVGIHNLGSLGTQSSVVSNNFNGQLSIISDFDQNGWTSKPLPSYAGDYFVPGKPIEGK